MDVALLTSRTAWSTALLLAAQTALGIVRVQGVSPESSLGIRARVLPFHIIFGIALPTLAFTHAWFSMRAPHAGQTNVAGLWIATIALLLLACQAVIGLSLLRARGSQAIGLRRLHLAMAVIGIAFAGLHLFLNG